MARISIDNDGDLEQGEETARLLHVAIEGTPGWLLDELHLGDALDRLDRALERYRTKRGDYK